MFVRRSEGLKAGPRNYNLPNHEPDKRTAEKALRDAGLTRKEAKTLLAQGYDASAALFGWQVDPLRDAGQDTKPQPDALRDAGTDGPYNIDDMMNRIFKLLH